MIILRVFVYVIILSIRDACVCLCVCWVGFAWIDRPAVSPAVWLTDSLTAAAAAVKPRSQTLLWRCQIFDKSTRWRQLWQRRSYFFSPCCLMSRDVAPLHLLLPSRGGKWHARASPAWRSRRCVRKVARGGSCELKWLASSVSWLAEGGGSYLRHSWFLNFTFRSEEKERDKNSAWLPWLRETPRCWFTSHIHT